jgi:hypothetical protein
MTKILRFEINIPAEVSLKEAGPGKPIEGRYGNRVMYTLTDDRVMYVAPIVASRISDLGIQPGELFHICKQIKRQGTQRLIEWMVERLPSESNTQLERDLRASLAAAQAAKAAQPPEPTNEEPKSQSHPISPEPITPSSTKFATAAPVESESDGKNPGTERQNGNGVQPVATDCACAHESPAPPPIKLPAPTVPSSNGSANGSPPCTIKNGNNPNAPPPVTTKLEHALKTAISAAHNAEKYGAELGYVVRFDADAIKSMAITVLINMSEGNRR